MEIITLAQMQDFVANIVNMITGNFGSIMIVFGFIVALSIAGAMMDMAAQDRFLERERKRWER